MFYSYGTWNWTNIWKLAFILILMAFFLGVVLEFAFIGKILFGIGGTLFIIMCVVRFEDFKEWMYDKSDE